MPDDIRSLPAPESWAAAFAALPPARPDTDLWPALAARLDARRGPRWPTWLTIAATLVLAVALPMRLLERAPAEPATDTAATSAPASELDRYYAESARLETLLAATRDERVASATGVALAGELDAELATIDAALRDPALEEAQRLALWQQRVDTLRTLVSFEGTQRWLAAQGERYDAALVRVD